MPLDTLTYEDEILSTLRKADALLPDESKWCQGTAFYDDRMCVYGAVVRAGCKINNPVAHWFFAFSNAYTGDPNVANYNDAPERTFEDIKAFLAAAIVQREAELVK